MESFVDVIKEGEIVRMPEARAIEEDLFILRKVILPDSMDVVIEPSKESKQKYQIQGKRYYSYLERWKAGKSYKKNDVVKDLVQNFQWVLVRKRRSLGLSRNDLAKAIGATENEMKSIELGELPKDDFVFISRIENKLGLDLRKERVPGGVSLSDLEKMNEEKVREEIEKTHERVFTGEEDVSLSGDDLEILED